MRSERIAIVLVAVLVLIGAAIRLRIAVNEAMWRDEAQTVAIASRDFPGGIISGLMGDGNSPLYYLLQHFVVAPRGSSFRELRDRSISMLFGVVLIPLAFVLGRAVAGGGSSTGVVLAAWTALAPAAVDVSTQARPYSMLMVAIAVLAIAVARVTQGTSSWTTWLTYAIAAASALYLHTLSAALLAATGIVLFFVARRRGYLRQWIVWHTAILFAVTPALLFAFQQVRVLTSGGRIPWGSETHFADLPRHTLALLLGTTSALPANLLGWVMLVSFIGAMVAGPPAARIIGTAALLGLIVSFAISYRSAGLVVRYNLPIALLLVAAMAAVFTMSASIHRLAPALTATSFVVIYALFAISSAGYYGLGRRSASRETANLILANGRADDVVVILPDTYAVAVNYYLPPRFRQLDLPELTRVDAVDFRGWSERFTDSGRMTAIEEQLTTTQLAGRRVWLVVWLPMTSRLPDDVSPRSVLPQQWRFGREVGDAFERHFVVARIPRLFGKGEGSVVRIGEPAKEKSR